MSTKETTPAQVTSIARENPLERMLRGESIPDIPRPHKQVAKIGNLWHEYIKDSGLQKKGVKSEDLASTLQRLGFMNVDFTTGLYSWKEKPLTKQRVLDMFNLDVKTKAAAAV